MVDVLLAYRSTWSFLYGESRSFFGGATGFRVPGVVGQILNPSLGKLAGLSAVLNPQSLVVSNRKWLKVVCLTMLMQANADAQSVKSFSLSHSANDLTHIATMDGVQ
jgi:hypothetical protein